MKKTGLLNSDVSMAIAQMGHLDTLVVADAGLPTPVGAWRIDLALRPGVPAFLDVVDAILSELHIERAIVAAELAQVSPQLWDALQGRLGGVVIEQVPHDEFKRRSASARAIVRSGEFTPYANVILVSGVVF